jgi:hypothetical protein
MQYVTCLSIPSNKKPKHKKRHWAGEREREAETEREVVLCEKTDVSSTVYSICFHFSLSLSLRLHILTQRKRLTTTRRRSLFFLSPPPSLSPLFFSGPLLYSSLSHFLSFFLFNSFCFFLKKTYLLTLIEKLLWILINVITNF